ncbi:uncharacterized oxidoreductase YjmC-like isoform X1 [Rhopilema esculentum]|uniref:uncharacterized oxidoreductase YjmC-like isoform X1 n=2 Tax=Rhopilema esculentum TaxID=499914 RepID=UPI0031CED8F6
MAALIDSYCLVGRSEVHDFVKRCMVATGVEESHAVDLANLLVAADTRGHFSHGINRLGMYVDDILLGTTAKTGSPEIVKEKAGTALVDAKNVLGPVAGKFCTDLAIQKAKEAGIGWVSCRGSNHYGIAGWYSMRASEQGLIGMSFTNTSPLQVPTRAVKPALGTNPISVAAPCKGDDFVLDMATSTAAVGKVEMNHRKGIEIPRGWGVDSQGKETNDPQKVLDGGGLLSVGGVESSGGYKGYGLAMMVEIFCGILSGSLYGPYIRSWLNASKEDLRPANLGQCFVAIDPSAFADGFEDRMADIMSYCRNLEPAEGETEVLVAGDPERKHIRKVEENGGIHYHVNVIEAMNKIADKLKVSKIETK